MPGAGLGNGGFEFLFTNAVFFHQLMQLARCYVGRVRFDCGRAPLEAFVLRRRNTGHHNSQNGIILATILANYCK